MAQKSRFLLFILILLLSTASWGKNINLTPDEKLSISVNYFENRTGDEEKWGWTSKGIADMIINDIVGSHYLKVVEREQIQDLFQELGLSMSGAISQSEAQQIGKMSGAKVTITGSITKIKDRIRLDARYIEVETSEIIGSASIEHEEDDLEDNFTRYIHEFSEEIKNDIQGSIRFEYAVRQDSISQDSIGAFEEKRVKSASTTDSKLSIVDEITERSFDVTAHFYRGLDFFDQGLYRLAENEYRLALSGDSLFVRARVNLGEMLRRQKKHDESISEFKKALKIQPKLDLAHYNLGLTYADMEKYKDAILSIKKAIELSPDSPDMITNLGVTYYKAGILDSAKIELEKAVDLNEEDKTARFNLGQVYWQSYQFDDAISEWEEVLELDENYIQAYICIAKACERLDKFDDAIENYEKILELQPGNGDILGNLGLLYMRKNKPEKALKNLRKAVNITPNNPSFHLGLATTYLALESFDNALAEFKITVALDPEGEYGELAKVYLQKFQE